MNTNIAEQNLNNINKAPREPKKEHFKDGDYRVPTTQRCTVCGREYHVTRQTAINRINKQYNGEIKKWLSEAVCSHCKREQKLEKQIQQLQEQKNKLESAKQQVVE